MKFIQKLEIMNGENKQSFISKDIVIDTLIKSTRETLLHQNSPTFEGIHHIIKTILIILVLEDTIPKQIFDSRKSKIEDYKLNYKLNICDVSRYYKVLEGKSIIDKYYNKTITNRDSENCLATKKGQKLYNKIVEGTPYDKYYLGQIYLKVFSPKNEIQISEFSLIITHK